MNNGLREMLEQLPTTQLDEMLQAELQKRPLDPEAVKMIMRILEEREEALEIIPEIQDAWKDFQKSEKASNNRRSWIGPLLRVASVILILGLLFVVMPREAGAQSLWDRLLYVTDSIFEFFNPSGANDHWKEYEFKTDNPGLQQVYDAVVEMGVTEPVVPMWLPEEYELVECSTVKTRTKTCINARFWGNQSEVIFTIEAYESVASHDYFKNELEVQKREFGGIIHSVLQNHDKLVAIWIRDAVECSLSISCQENVLYEILKSVYTVRDE